MRRLFTIMSLFTIVLLCSGQSKQKAFKISDFKFDTIFGSTESDKNTIYCLLGSGFFKSPHSENVDGLIKNWIESHKDAKVVPVSSFGSIISGVQDSKMVYCWVIQGKDTLNTYIIRYGGFPGGTMIRPRTWDEMEQWEKDSFDTDNKPNIETLVSKEEYNNFIEKVKQAEIYARENSLGIWKNYEEEDDR